MVVNGVDSNGVSQQVIGALEAWRERQEDMSHTSHLSLTQANWLTFDMTVSQRDAEYIVECLRVLLQQDIIAQRTVLSLDDDEISDEAVDVFGGFLRETPCYLQALYLWNLPHQQFRRLLAALKTNMSVKKLCIYKLQDNEGSLWISNLLRHKKDFMQLYLRNCCFPLIQILPLLRGQPNLQSLSFDGCRISSDILLFNDPESTQLFVNNILLSPYTTLKALFSASCGVSLDNRPLMAGLHNNTTLVESWTENAAINRFHAPIALRNINLAHVNSMLGTTTSSAGSSSSENTTNTILPPPTGLWPTVLAKVGRGSQGATPVFTILCNRLATWMGPSQHWLQVPRQHANQQELEQEEEDQFIGDSSRPTKPAAINDTTTTTSAITATADPEIHITTEDGKRRTAPMMMMQNTPNGKKPKVGH